MVLLYSTPGIMKPVRLRIFIRRLKMLMCRIIVIQNDFASIEKELAIDTEVLNIILVINISIKSP